MPSNLARFATVPCSHLLSQTLFKRLSNYDAQSCGYCGNPVTVAMTRKIGSRQCIAAGNPAKVPRALER
jgi:hypothetical protein